MKALYMSKNLSDLSIKIGSCDDDYILKYKLSKSEGRILKALLDTREHAITKEKLKQIGWDSSINDNAVAITISNLRKMLQSICELKFIDGNGYILHFIDDDTSYHAEKSTLYSGIKNKSDYRQCSFLLRVTIFILTLTNTVILLLEYFIR